MKHFPVIRTKYIAYNTHINASWNWEIKRGILHMHQACELINNYQVSYEVILILIMTSRNNMKTKLKKKGHGKSQDQGQHQCWCQNQSQSQDKFKGKLRLYNLLKTWIWVEMTFWHTLNDKLIASFQNFIYVLWISILPL